MFYKKAIFIFALYLLKESVKKRKAFCADKNVKLKLIHF